MKQKSTKLSRPLKIVLFFGFLIILGAGGLGVWAALNANLVADYFSAINYAEPADIAQLRAKLNLTNRAALILAASAPALADRADFNATCNSHNSEIAVLGCYTNNTIFVYNIDDTELSGIIESTLAHELLHAVWARTDAATRSSLEVALADIFNDPDYHDLLATELSSYGEDAYFEELYARIGTEITNLPEILENHYAETFRDQNSIVTFYQNYSGAFSAITSELDALADQLSNLALEIYDLTISYRAAANTLAGDVETFNACANTTNCFADDAVFNDARAELLNRQAALDETYQNLSNLIDQYNTLADEYNAALITNDTLYQTINSNSITEEKIL